jgi:hypothetical protein
MKEKPWLKRMVPMTSPLLWEAFDDMLNYSIELQRKQMEQTENTVEIYRAQGSIQSLKRLKQLKEEIQNAQAQK